MSKIDKIQEIKSTAELQKLVTILSSIVMKLPSHNVLEAAILSPEEEEIFCELHNIEFDFS